MLATLTLLLVCQLAGELIAVASGLPLPGPVIGMIILFALLMLRGGIPEDLSRTGSALLSNLSLLFVPAGVGVMVHFSLLERDWLPISVALLVSTVATIIVTAWLMQFTTRLMNRNRPEDNE